MANKGELRRVSAAPMARLTGEAIARLAAPEVAARLVRDALDAAGLRDVPEDPSGFGSFACGPLKIAVTEALGEEAADAVMQDLGPAFLEVQRSGGGELPSSGVRRRGRESLTRPASPARVVLIASHEPAVVDALLPSFGAETKVVAAYDVFGLLQSSQRYLDHPLVLLLHDEMPSIRPSSLATIARVMPASTTIVQFGAKGVEPDRTSEVPPLTWVRLGDAPPFAVLEACAELFPSSGSPAVTSPRASQRVILAHGDGVVRTEIAARLRHAGHDVFETETGFGALDRCIDAPPDVLVVARHVPALDGHQLAALVATRFGSEAPPVLILGRRGGAAPSEVAQVVDERDIEGLLAALETI